MKENPKRYINPFLSDVQTDKVNFTTNLDDGNYEKSLEPSNVPSEYFNKAKEEYIDKNVTECQLPEVVTCYEEMSTGFNVVKDICVDEGIISHGEMIKCDKEHHELSCNPFTVNGDKHDHMIDSQLNSTPFEDKLKLFVESNIASSNENFGPDNAMQNSVEDVDQQLSDQAQLAGFEANEPTQTSHTIDDESEPVMDENKASSVKPTTTSGLHEQPLSTESAPNHHDLALSSITVAPHGGGESSFSMAAPVSGLITYSGPITAYGSISHRSDGSNASVRSFAFPILQDEWNSSPVRMAKADPKESRKHRGWWQAFICCRS